MTRRSGRWGGRVPNGLRTSPSGSLPEAEEAGAEIDEVGLAGDDVGGVEGVEVGAAAADDACLAEDAEVLGGHAFALAAAGGEFLGHERLAFGEFAEDADAVCGREDLGEGFERDAGDGGRVLRGVHGKMRVFTHPRSSDCGAKGQVHGFAPGFLL